MAGGLRRGEVRLVQFAQPDKLRPVLILTTNATLPKLTKVTVAPITSTLRDVPSQVVLDESDGMKNPCAVNLHNITTVQQQDVGRRLATLSPERMDEVCAALHFALGCESD